MDGWRQCQEEKRKENAKKKRGKRNTGASPSRISRRKGLFAALRGIKKCSSALKMRSLLTFLYKSHTRLDIVSL